MPSPKRALWAVLFLALICTAGAAAGYRWLEHEFAAPATLTHTVRLQVEQGASVRSVLAQLASLGAIRNARAVEWYLRVHGRRPRIQAGAYEIPAAARPAEILQLFAEGRVILEQLTAIEGATFADLRAALDAHPAIAHILQGRRDAELMSAIGHPGEAPEGRFFPDTYRFAARTSDRDILSLAYNSMQRLLDAAWAERDPDLPFATPYEALILASIIEKESALPEERARIAAVFVNRLRRGMRLQSDPTVIYGMGERYDGNIHTRDLISDTPYNTYARAGLPPTPIALPGRESVMAAVHPLKTAELYFVATGLGDGAHHFSSTLEEHNAAVKAYLARLRRQQRDEAAQAPRDGAR